MRAFSTLAHLARRCEHRGMHKADQEQDCKTVRRNKGQGHDRCGQGADRQDDSTRMQAIGDVTRNGSGDEPDYGAAG